MSFPSLKSRLAARQFIRKTESKSPAVREAIYQWLTKHFEGMLLDGVVLRLQQLEPDNWMRIGFKMDGKAISVKACSCCEPLWIGTFWIGHGDKLMVAIPAGGLSQVSWYDLSDPNVLEQVELALLESSRRQRTSTPCCSSLDSSVMQP